MIWCRSDECDLRGSTQPLSVLRKEDLFLSGERCWVSTVLMSETLSVHYLRREKQMRCCRHSRGDYRLVNYICIKKDSSLLFHSPVSSRFIYGPEPSLPLDFLFPLHLWAPLPPSSWWSPKSYSRPHSLFCPQPLLLGKASALTDEVLPPSGGPGSIKWSSLRWPAGPASPYRLIEDPGLPMASCGQSTLERTVGEEALPVARRQDSRQKVRPIQQTTWVKITMSNGRAGRPARLTNKCPYLRTPLWGLLRGRAVQPPHPVSHLPRTFFLIWNVTGSVYDSLLDICKSKKSSLSKIPSLLF